MGATGGAVSKVAKAVTLLKPAGLGPSRFLPEIRVTSRRGGT